MKKTLLTSVLLLTFAFGFAKNTKAVRHTKITTKNSSLVEKPQSSQKCIAYKVEYVAMRLVIAVEIMRMCTIQCVSLGRCCVGEFREILC